MKNRPCRPLPSAPVVDALPKRAARPRTATFSCATPRAALSYWNSRPCRPRSWRSNSAATGTAHLPFWARRGQPSGGMGLARLRPSLQGTDLHLGRVMRHFQLSRRRSPDRGDRRLLKPRRMEGEFAGVKSIPSMPSRPMPSRQALLPRQGLHRLPRESLEELRFLSA
jgi:hypothetical protein